MPARSIHGITCLCRSTAVIAFQLLLLAGAAAPLTAQQSILGSRTGNVLDSLERRYFNLFPGIEGFVSASVSRSHDTAVAFTISRDRGRGDTVIQTSLRIASELRRYLERYEWLFAGDSTRIDWAALRHLVRPSNPIQENPIGVNVLTRTGEQVRGALLYANDSMLVLSASRSSEPKELLQADFRILHVLEIDRVQDDRSVTGRLFYAFDLPVRGNMEVFREDVLRLHLTDRLYPERVPPEIHARLAVHHETMFIVHPPVRQELIEQEKGGRLSSLFASTGHEALGRRRMTRWNTIHLHAAMGTIVHRDIEHYGIWTVWGWRYNTMRIPERSFVSLGADISLVPWLRLGVSYSLWQRPNEVADSSSHYLRVLGDGLQLTASLVPVRPGSTSYPLLNRIEVALEAGVAIRFLTVDNVPYNEDLHETLIGSTVALSAAYYPVDLVSIGPVLRALFYPKSEPVEEHTVLLNSFDLLLRASIHL